MGIRPSVGRCRNKCTHDSGGKFGGVGRCFAQKPGLAAGMVVSYKGSWDGRSPERIMALIPVNVNTFWTQTQ